MTKRITKYTIDEKTAIAIVKVTGAIKTVDLWNKFDLSKEETKLLSELYDAVTLTDLAQKAEEQNE